MRAFTLASTVLALAANGLLGQPAPAFEVASVKASPPRTGTAMVRYSNITLKILIAIADHPGGHHRACVVGYHVVDKTGLPGAFDIDLRFTPENSKEPGPDLLTCIQEQLGLKLEPGRAPVEMIIVDRAEPFTFQAITWSPWTHCSRRSVMPPETGRPTRASAADRGSAPRMMLHTSGVV